MESRKWLYTRLLAISFSPTICTICHFVVNGLEIHFGCSYLHLWMGYQCTSMWLVPTIWARSPNGLVLLSSLGLGLDWVSSGSHAATSFLARILFTIAIKKNSQASLMRKNSNESFRLYTNSSIALMAVQYGSALRVQHWTTLNNFEPHWTILNNEQ